MAGRIPNEFIQELLSRADIVSVINSHVPLTQAGRDFKACCPFHNEKTPSFYVSPVKQFYHCFGCGESGTAIQFLMKYGNYRFPDAIEELATSVGIKVPREFSRSSEHGEYTQIVELMGKVNSEYQAQLYRSARSDEAKAYLKNRGITFEAAQAFGLGFAPDEWDFVLNKFGRSEPERVLLEKAGLIIRKDSNKTYDRFRGRLMFPIEDRRGRVIAFGGRVIGDGEPKYLNSPETVLFKKGNELFGFKKALPAIKSEGKVLVVEGYTDVVGLAQFDIENVVATLGTAVTPFHIKELFRTIDDVVFCFDGDEAGVRAAWRAVEATLPLIQDGHLVSFVFLPEGQDPDSMVREEGSDVFRERISSGEPITDFIFRMLLNRSNIERTDGRAKFAAEFGKVISKLQHSMLRQMMLAELARRTGLSVSDIRSVLGPVKSNRSVSKATPGKVKLHSLTGRFVSLLVQNPEWGKYTIDLEDVEVLKDPNIWVLSEVLKILRREPTINTAGIVEKFRSSDYFSQVQLFAGAGHSSSDEELKDEFQGMIMKLRERVAKQHARDVLARRDENKDEADLQDALQQLKDNYVLKKNAQERRNIN